MNPPLPTLLVSGFEPFGGDSVNSSWEIAHRLDGVDGIRAVQLPCRFATSLVALDAALASRPSLVLALGQAASRPVLSFERVAINWVDARIADNDGAQPVDEAVLAGAPAAYFTRLPIKRMAQAAREAGAAAEISYSAGSFVCNQLFFGLQHRLRQRKSVRSGFLHVPAPGGAVGLETMVAGVRAAVAVARANAEDLHHSGGRED